MASPPRPGFAGFGKKKTKSQSPLEVAVTRTKTVSGWNGGFTLYVLSVKWIGTQDRPQEKRVVIHSGSPNTSRHSATQNADFDDGADDIVAPGLVAEFDGSHHPAPALVRQASREEPSSEWATAKSSSTGSLPLTWEVHRRYSEFVSLHKKLSNRIQGLPALPPKPLFGTMDANFISKRREALNEFVQHLIAIPKVFNSRHFAQFMDIDEQRILELFKGMAPKLRKLQSKGAKLDNSLTPNDFELLRVIGKGTFGKVLQVRKKDTGNIYAMKVLSKQTVLLKKQVKNTKTERKVLELIDHPFIVSLKFAFQTQDKLYMVLDYFTGGELFFHLNKGRFKEDRAQFFAAELVLSLECLHAHGIIYRDLKPENILLDEDGHVRLTDFGLSKESVSEGEVTHTFCGTPHYLAPEIINRQGYGKEVDWWSLGTLLFEMVTGLPPFYHTNVKKMYENICYAKLVFPPHLSENCKSILSALLDRKPERRLGHGPLGSANVKAHPFWEGIDFPKLLAKEIPPRFKPKVTEGKMDIKNVAKCFTQLKVTDSPPRTTNRRLAAAAAKLHFEDFTYNGDKRSKLSDMPDQSKTHQAQESGMSQRHDKEDLGQSMVAGSLGVSRLSIRDEDGGLGEEDLGLARYKYDSDDDDPVLGERKSAEDGVDALGSSPPTVPVEPKFEALMTRPQPGQEVEGREVDEAWASAAAGPAYGSANFEE